MTERMMIFIDLHKRRKLATANVLGTLTALGERAAGRQMGDIGRQARDLIKLFSLLVCRIGDAF